MEKTYFYILSFLVFSTSFCDSEDYKYDHYKYEEYNYDKNYDYDNQKPDDYTDDYSQESNYYYDHNLLAPPNPPPLSLSPSPPLPPLTTMVPMGKITLLFTLKSQQIKLILKTNLYEF